MSAEPPNGKAVPWWVFAAVSYIKTSRGGAWLVWSCVASCLYCVPWVRYFPGDARVARLFLAPDWTWNALMVPMTAWYWAAVRHMDRNNAWPGN